MNSYFFGFILSEEFELHSRLEDSVYECGCSDGILGCVNNVCYIEFNRSSGRYIEAITSAIEELNNTSCSIKIHRIIPSDIISEEELADKFDISHNQIKAWVNHQSKNMDFPLPNSMSIDNGRFLWSYTEILQYLQKRKSGVVPEFIKNINLSDQIDGAVFIRDFNLKKERNM